MELEHKTFPSYEFKVLDEEKGIVEAIVSVFNNTDLGGDIVRPGFFDKALQKKMPKAVWMHDATRPIGKTLKTYPLLAGDPRLPEPIKHLGGQYVKGQLNLDVQDGRDALSHLKFGSIDEFSFAYYVAPGGAKYLDNGTRELMSADEWPEWSPVLQGMNPATALISAKSADGETNDGLPLAQDLEEAIAAAKRIAERTTKRADLLRKEGRMLSAATVAKLKELVDLLDQVDTVQGVLQDLIDMASPPASADTPTDMGKARVDSLALKMRLARARLQLIELQAS